MMKHKVLFGMILLVGTLGLMLSATAQTPAIPFQLPSTLFYSNMDPAIKKQITEDLALASSISFSKTSALHQQLFGKPIHSNGYLSWFLKRIKTVVVGNCANNDAAVACVIPILEQNKIRLTQRYVQMNAPQIARMSVIFHEAKHTEVNLPLKDSDPDLRYWLHAKCPTPFLDEKNQERISIWTGVPLSGLDGCDATPVGSYGTAVIMLRNIASYSKNTTDKLKADATIYADDQLTRIIDAKAHDQLTADQ